MQPSSANGNIVITSYVYMNDQKSHVQKWKQYSNGKTDIRRAVQTVANNFDKIEI